jgi:hypothetical protein
MKAIQQFYLLLVLVSMILLGCGNGRVSDAPKAAKMDFHPYVALTSSGVQVRNGDKFIYPSPRVMINLNQSGARHAADVGDVASGQTITIPYYEFTDRDGERFNVLKTKVYTIVIRTPLQPDPSYVVSICPKTIGLCVRSEE